MGEKQSKDDFMRLFLSNQRRIFAFIMMFVPNRSDAEDLMQETASWMWENFDKFAPGTSFGAWGVQVARFKILNLNRTQKSCRLKFRDDVVQLIDERAETILGEADHRVYALRKCLSKMPEHDRWLIYLRYEKGLTTKKLAQLVERPVRGLYKTMSRVHKVLFQCVRRTLALEGEH